MSTVDWRLAQHVAEMVAGSPDPQLGTVKPPTISLDELVASIGSYARLSIDGAPPPLELVDRPRWIAANLKTARPLLEPLSDRIGAGLGPLAPAARSASGFLLGVQIGALTGALAQRVLGQYDLMLLDASVEPKLLLVAPNLAQAARNLDVSAVDLTSWVTIHEATHAVQFGGAPWLRDHLGDILRELVKSLEVSMAADRGFGLRNLMSLGDLASRRDEITELVARARKGELLRITLGEERWQLVERMQATMSLIEGHAEHVMDVIGAQTLPTLPKLRAAMTRRRQSRTLPWRVIERLLGLELKMRQYEVGRRFCDAVVAEAGASALASAWSSPETLPSMAELEHPASWLARVN